MSSKQSSKDARQFLMLVVSLETLLVANWLQTHSSFVISRIVSESRLSWVGSWVTELVSQNTARVQ
jgi:hypothetical protein